MHVCRVFQRRLDPTPKLLVKYDVDTGEAIRDKQGLCVPVQTGSLRLLSLTNDCMHACAHEHIHMLKINLKIKDKFY